MFQVIWASWELYVEKSQSLDIKLLIWGALKTIPFHIFILVIVEFGSFQVNRADN